MRVLDEIDDPIGDADSRGTDMRVVGVLLAMIVVFSAGVVVAQSWLPVAAAPERVPPTFSRNDSGTPLPTEAEVWGAIWSRTQGTGVLRPTWLPRQSDSYQVGEVGAPSVAALRYVVFYVESRSQAGAAVWSVEFIADAQAVNAQHFSGTARDVELRGTVARLFGNGDPGWTLEWTEGGFRYAIEAYEVSSGDLLRIAASLAPVVDAAGRTAARP